MWSMFSQDFSDFAKAFQSESAGLVDYLGHMASEVVGRGDVYAGDEVLKETTRSMPLPNELLRRLQASEATYALPIQPEEREAFAAWQAANPLSSRNTQQRRQGEEEAAAAAAGGSPQPPGAVSMTPNRRSAEWPDEPADETRQRLLDYNDVVLQRYMALVGNAVSPRSSIPASPATPEPRRRPQDPPTASNFDASSEGGSPAAAGVREGSAARQRPTSPDKGPGAEQVTEDDFFDRYFFRLSQLRLSESQRRRRHNTTTRAEGDDEEEEEEGDSAGVSPLPALARSRDEASSTHTTPQSRSPQANPNDASRQSTATTDDDFVAVPLFAKRMMTAASGFVTNIDNAINNVVAAETSRCSGDALDARGADWEDESANVNPSELVRYGGARRQIAELEALVQELQEALRQERRRVQQLTTVLETHRIEIPAAASEEKEKEAGEGEKVRSPAATPQKHTDPSPTAAAAAAQSDDAQATAGVLSSSHSKAADASTSAEKVSGVISAGSEGEEEEDDEAWVNVTPCAEPTA